jgi:hypothetical protein
MMTPKATKEAIPSPRAKFALLRAERDLISAVKRSPVAMADLHSDDETMAKMPTNQQQHTVTKME